MKILSLNTWQERGPWRERWEVILRGLEEYRPDIIGFQEVFNADWVRKIQRRSGYFSLALAGKGETGLALMSRYPLLRWQCLKMRTQSPTEPYSRYALFAEFGTGKGTVSVFNTHLSWRLPESSVRQKQVGELSGFIQNQAIGGEIAVMGDFNATPDAPEIAQLMKQGDLTDTYGQRYPKKPGLTWSHANPYSLEAARLDACYPLPERRIDYIFVKKGSRLVKSLQDIQIVYTRRDARGFWASDHYGLLASIAEGTA